MPARWKPFRSATTASCWWWRAIIRWPDATKIAFAEVLDHDFVGLDRASALQRFLADKAAASASRCELRVQLRSFDAVCRLVECNVGIGIVPETTARRVAQDDGDQGGRTSTDAWARARAHDLRRDVDELSPFARQLVEHLRSRRER